MGTWGKPSYEERLAEFRAAEQEQREADLAAGWDPDRGVPVEDVERERSIQARIAEFEARGV